MPTYNKPVKRSKDGTIPKYVGINRKGVPEKFRLGYDLAEADRRLRLIKALWEHMEVWVSAARVNIEIKGTKALRAFWTAPYLAAAKAIAKGEPPTLPKGEYEQPDLYLKRLGLISEASGCKFEPANLDEYETAVYLVKRSADEARNTIAEAARVPAATGQTLKDAIVAYEEAIRRRHSRPDGAIDAWGKARLDQMSSIRSYLSDKRFGGENQLRLDLAELTFQRCDEIFGIFRGRPLTFLSDLKRRMAPASAKNYIKELGSFFDWLDGADDFEWIQPRRFRKIARTPDKLTPQERYERRQKKQQSVIPSEHLKTLFEYSLPIERILILLGLNCAFGAAEIGHLRTGFLELDENIIDGIRFKTGNDTKHRLWPETVAGLRWVLDRRRQQKTTKPEYKEIVFLTERNKPMWHHTKKGNTSNGVSNVWDRLIKRVRKDTEAFPSYSFKQLRKTSATRILEIASAEVASMILAHKTISDDELLETYTLIPWKKLFAAQDQYRQELDGVVTAGDGDPWSAKRKTYIGIKKSKRILELDEMDVSAQQIADELNISVATVYRHLQAKHGERQSGRKPGSNGAENGNGETD